MQIGMTLPTMVEGLDRETLLGWCRDIDDGPWSTLAVGERIAFPNMELFAALAAAAAVTDRVALAASVVVLPMHPAVEVAKWAATVDVLSEGRLILGVGVGGRDEDYDALGACSQDRHRRLDAQVATMRQIWDGLPPAEGITPIGPAPVQVHGPTIWSGALGPKAMTRAAGWADGIVGFLTDPLSPSAAAPVDRATRAWAAAGRPEPPRMVTTFWYGTGSGGERRARDYARRYLGVFGPETADALAAEVSAVSAGAVGAALDHLEAAGYDEVLLVPTSAERDELDAVAALVTR